MAEITLADDELYLHPTPAGAYYCVSNNHATPIRRLLQTLLREPRYPRLTEERLLGWTGLATVDQAKEVLFHAQQLGWIAGFEAPEPSPEETLETLLPRLLGVLSQNGRVLLADQQGFYLSTHGFNHEVAEELSALSADLANLHARRSGLLDENLGISGGAWAVVDAAGNGKIGFWPLFIGNHRFVIVVSGLPQFNHPDFVKLAWVLTRRYSAVAG